MNNEQRITEIEARCEAATPGPYTVGYECDGNGAHEILAGGRVIAKVDCDKNADFIAHARDDVPFLLSQLAAKDKEIERQGTLIGQQAREMGRREGIIETIKKERDKLTEAQRWRNAETEPPKCYGHYVMEFYTGVVGSARYLTSGSWQCEDEHYKSGINGVIRWVPFPAPKGE
jgi:hypothetical protein